MSSWLSIIGSIVGLIYVALKFFIKSPEQKEQEDLEKQREHQAELDQAMNKMRDTHDPSDLSRIINH